MFFPTADSEEVKVWSLEISKEALIMLGIKFQLVLAVRLRLMTWGLLKYQYGSLRGKPPGDVLKGMTTGCPSWWSGGR